MLLLGANIIDNVTISVMLITIECTEKNYKVSGREGIIRKQNNIHIYRKHNIPVNIYNKIIYTSEKPTEIKYASQHFIICS